MPVTVQTEKYGTSRFIERTPFLPLLSVLVVLLALFLSIFFPEIIEQDRVQVQPQETVKLDSIRMERDPIGALRIDVKAILPSNTWVTYQIELLDPQGERLAAARKEAWRESGIWREDGESGTWSESDVLGGLDVRLGKEQQEDVTIAISVEEHGTKAGRLLEDPVPFQVIVEKGVIDTRYLIAGLFGTSAFSLLSLLSFRNTGKPAIRKQINDSDVGARAILGGHNSLIKVVVLIEADETSPPYMNVDLWVKDGQGKQIYSETLTARMRFDKDDNGEIQKAVDRVSKFFVLERRGSYGFYVEVRPDEPVDRTTLTVRENVKTITGKNPVVNITVS
jgi:hypothetical protein